MAVERTIVEWSQIFSQKMTYEVMPQYQMCMHPT